MFERIDYPVTEDVRLAVGRFVANAYKSDAQYKYPDRWRWCYEQPGGHSFVAWSDGQIVGHVGAMPVTVRCGTRELRALWSVDTFVLPERRGRGLGNRLQRNASEFGPLFMSVWMSEPNWRIKIALGHAPIASMTVLESTNALQSVAPYRVEAPDPQRIADVAAEALTEFDFFVIRSREYCLWRYVQQPFAEYSQVTTEYGVSLARKCGPRRPNVGMISDVLCGAARAIPLQIESTAHALAESGCERILFATADLGVAAALVVRGWTVVSRSDLLVNSVPAGSRLRRPFLSLADQDIDQYPG